MLTQEKVREFFNYDENTGTLKWNITCCKVFKGKICKSLDRDGYLRVSVKGKGYRVHRLIWLWHYGYMPENIIDHIDRDKTNNRIENLREASHFCSSQNRDNFKSNTSGVKGITWSKALKKWKVTIMDNNVNKHGGYFTSFEEAAAMRLALEQCLGYTGCNSTSPAYRHTCGK